MPERRWLRRMVLLDYGLRAAERIIELGLGFKLCQLFTTKIVASVILKRELDARLMRSCRGLSISREPSLPCLSHGLESRFFYFYIAQRWDGLMIRR